MFATPSRHEQGQFIELLNKSAGAVNLTGWRLVDLFNFRVRLKAEFQASNKDLYRDELTAGQSAK